MAQIVPEYSIDAIIVPIPRLEITEAEGNAISRLQFRLEEALKKPEKNKDGDTVYRVNFIAPEKVLRSWLAALEKIKGLFKVIRARHIESVKVVAKTIKEEAKQKVSIKSMIADNQALVTKREQQKKAQGLIPEHKNKNQNRD